MTNSDKKLEKPNSLSEKRAKASRNFLLIIAVSVAALILIESAFSFENLSDWLKILIALAHIPFTILVAVIGWQALKGLDEMQRLIHIQAFIIGITISGSLLLSYSLLTYADVVSGKQTYLFLPLLWTFYSLAYAYLGKKMS